MNFRRQLLLVSTTCVFVAGCSVSPLTKRAVTFSTAATAAATDTANAYQMVEDTYYQAQVASLVVSFDENGFDPNSIKAFMPEKDMEARTEVIEGLHEYAELLAEVSGDAPVTALNTQTQALGTALQNFSTDNLKSWAPPAADVNLAVTALNGLGRILIERKRSRALPGILDQMKKPIEDICALLQEDIGDPQKSGLRNQLKNSYAELIRKQQQYIHKNEASMSAADKRAEIEKLPKLAASQAQSDRVLAKTQRELADMAKAHTALAETAHQKESPTFRVLVAQLARDGEQLNDVYRSLPTK